jgi:hypothetical protein
VLVGALSHSGRFRVWFSEADDQAHVVVGLDEVRRRFGGTARRWRVDRMATVIKPGTDQVQRSFVPVAKHYGVEVDPCPPRYGNRKWVVEKAIDHPTQSWWRTARVHTPTEAQASAGAIGAGRAARTSTKAPPTWITVSPRRPRRPPWSSCGWAIEPDRAIGRRPRVAMASAARATNWA